MSSGVSIDEIGSNAEKNYENKFIRVENIIQLKNIELLHDIEGALYLMFRPNANLENGKQCIYQYFCDYTRDPSYFYIIFLDFIFYQAGLHEKYQETIVAVLQYIILKEKQENSTKLANSIESNIEVAYRNHADKVIYQLSNMKLINFNIASLNIRRDYYHRNEGLSPEIKKCRHNSPIAKIILNDDIHELYNAITQLQQPFEYRLNVANCEVNPILNCYPTILQYAAFSNSFNCVKYLIENRFNPRIATIGYDSLSYTALSYAIAGGNVEIAQFLISIDDQNLRCNLTEDDEKISIVYHTRHLFPYWVDLGKQLDIYLIQSCIRHHYYLPLYAENMKKVKINVFDLFNDCCYINHLDLLKYLQKVYSPFDFRTGLALACRNGHFETVNHLIKNGIDFNFQIDIPENHYYLKEICRFHHFEQVLLVLARDGFAEQCPFTYEQISLNHPNMDWETRILYYNRTNPFLFLKAISFYTNFSPLIDAIRFNHPKILKCIFDSNPRFKFNKIREGPLNLLMLSVRYNNKTAMKIMLKERKEFNVNEIFDNDGLDEIPKVSQELPKNQTILPKDSVCFNFIAFLLMLSLAHANMVII